MKLHLPSGLRAALFACFAAFAGLSTTLSTATVAGGVFAVTMAGQAMAEVFDADVDKISIGDTSGCVIEVTDGKTVTAGEVDGSGSYVKQGEGTLIVSNTPSSARPAAITVENGVLQLNYQRWGISPAANSISVLKDGKLHLTAENALGTTNTDGDQTIKLLSLQGNSGSEVATLELDKSNLFRHELVMGGNSLLSGSGALKIDNQAAKITVTGDNNTISLKLDVGDGAVLTKAGAGTLTLACSASAVSGTLNVTEGTVKNTDALSLAKLTVASGASFINESALTITGTLTLGSAIQMGSGATFSMAEGATLDLSNLDPDEEGGKTFTLLTAAPGVTDAQLDLSSLAGVNIIGVSTEGGVQWSFTGGKLTYKTVDPIVYGGGTLEWNATDTDFTQNGAQVAFSNGDYVVFEATSDVTVQGALSASGMEVDAGATVSLALGKYTEGESEKESTLNVSRLVLNGVVEIKNNTITFGRIDAGENAEVIINWGGSGDGAKWTDENLGVYSGKVVVKNGNFTLARGNQYKHVTVENGGRADIRENATYVGDFSIAGMGANGNPGALSFNKGAKVDGKVTVCDAGSDVATAIAVWNEGIGTVKGTLDLQGALQVGANNWSNGTLRLEGDIIGGAGISVAYGTLQIGNDNATTSALETGDVTIDGGATLYLYHGGGGSFLGKDGAAANLTMKNGSTLQNFDIQDSSSGHQWGELTVDGTANVSFGTGQGVQKFTNLTAGDGTHAVDVHSNNDSNRQQIHFEQITDFNGSITYYLWSDEAKVYEKASNAEKIHIGSVSQKEGAALAITGGATSSAFAKTGAGSLTVDKLVVAEGGKLTVNYEGTLTIDALTLGNNATLAYTSVTDSVLSLDADLFSDKTFTLDVSALDQTALSAGLNTGIAGTVDNSIFTLNLGALTNANVRFEKDETNNVWKLVCDAPVDTSIWHWNTPGDAGVWADDNANGWAVGEGDSPSGRNVVFGADGLGDGSETTVKIAGEVKAASILVETAVGKTYTFTGDGDDTTANDGITAGALTKTGEGALVISTANSSTDDLTIEAGTVTFSGGDWNGAIAVNGSATLDVSSVADDAIGAITAEEGATVMVGSGVTVASLTGGKLETAVATRDVTITSATNLVSVSNAGTGTLIIGSDLTTGKLANAGKVSLLGDSTITEMSNTGTVTTGGKNIAITTVTNGGTLDAGAGTVTLGSDGTFTSLKAGSVTTAGKTITVEESSSLGTVSSSTETASSLVVKAGTTTIGTSSLQNLSVSSKATVSASLASLTVLGDITTAADGTGTATDNKAGVEATNDITVGGSATIAGRLVSDAGAISVGADVSTSAELGAATTVTIGGTATITGGLSSGGKVTLGKGGTIGDTTAKTGDLKVGGTLSLGGALTVGGAVSGVTRIEVTDAAALAGTMVSAGGLTMGDALTFAFSSGTLSPVAAGAADVPYTLFTLTDTNTAIDSLLGTDLSKLALEVAGENVEAIDSLSVKIETTTYTLGVDATSNSIVLIAKNTGLVWNVPSDGTGSTLSQGSSDEFGGGASTSLEKDADLIFNGGGTTGTDDKIGVVNVDGSVQVGSITIDAANTTYTFSGEEGDSLTSETLNIKNGDVANTMTFTVTGAVAAADATIENTGTFSVGEGSEIGGITGSGLVIVTGSAFIGSIGSVDGATSLTTQNTGTTPTTVTLMDITSPIALDIAANTTVTVSPAATFALYAASSDLVLTSLTSGGTLNVPDKNVILEQKTTGGGTLTALSLNLEKATGSSFTGITTDALTLDASALSTTTALLSSGSLSSLSGADITLTLTGITGAVADGLAYADYLLISGLDAKVGIAELSDDLRQLFALSAQESYALYDWVENAGKWDLVLSVKQDDPRYWTGGDLSDGSSDDKWAGSLGDDDKPQHVLDLSKVDRYEALDTVDNVRLDTNTTIDLTAATLDTTANPDGLIIRQLEGTADLTLKGDAADLATLDNTAGATTLDGDLTVQGMQVVAQGGNALTVGDLTVKTNTIGADAHAGSLTVSGTGSIIAANATANGGSITVEQGGKLDVGSMTLTGTNASVTNSGTFDADSLTLGSSSASFNAAAGTTNVGSLNGTAGKIDGTLNVIGTGGSYAGNYGSNAAIVLGSTAGAAEQNLTIGTETTGSENLAVTATKDAELTLTYTDGGATLKSLNADGATVVLENAGTNTLTVTDTANSTLKNGNLGFHISATDVANGNALEVTKGLNLDGTTVWVAQAGSVSSATFDVTKGTEGWTLFTLTDGTAENVTVKLDETDPFFRRYFEAGSVRVENGVVKADLITDYYTRDLAQTENGTEAMEMLDAAALAVNPQTGDLADVLKSLDSFKNPATRDAAAADKLAAAVAGSGIASLGMALSGDVERQLKAIRNRTTTMGVDPNVVNEDMPYFNAWINAEGDYRSMDDGGTLAGYTVNSYGGTVGFDMDVTPELTWGLALTAMYGDFESDTVDKVDGDMDTYYVSAFARAMSGAWTHTFVATLGISRSELSRTVSHNSGSYTAEGDADGISFGVLYEVARTYALNEDATACWQPVFNVAYRHIEVDGYEESGSEAALRVGDQSLDTVTFGLGARLQAVAGENIYNRTSIFEARALVKFDAGDRESEVKNALLAAPSTTAKVKSAEMDAVGLEVGVGLTVPVGFDAGSIFVDGSLEFRGSYTNFNAAAGYRVNF